jgi:hypothetical protein
MKRPLMILFSLFACVMSGACLTTELYSKPIKHANSQVSFNEDVKSFLITNDQRQLVIIGQKNHYIFPLNHDLREILMWNGRSKVMATGLNFVISKNNKINGSYHLKPREMATLTEADQTFMAEHGFKVAANANKEWVYTGRLSDGTVYDAGQFKMPAGQSFNEPYHLKISYDYDRDYAYARGYAERALLTPVAVAADGLIVVGAVVASPIILLFLTFGGGLNVH